MVDFPQGALAVPEVELICDVYTPKFDHVMIDIETMSLHRHKALILSVGMIEFDPNDPKGLHWRNDKLMVLPVVPQLLLGRRVEEGTQKFWREQSPEARLHWEHPEPTTVYALEAAILKIRSYCMMGATRVWANGTQFDLSNLDGLAEDIGATKELWHYRAPRDMRTWCMEHAVTRMVPIGDALDIPGVAHEPVFDCISQAWRVWSTWG